MNKMFFMLLISLLEAIHRIAILGQKIVFRINQLLQLQGMTGYSFSFKRIIFMVDTTEAAGSVN